MRARTAVGVALLALATAALAQVATTPGQGNTTDVQVEEPAPAANDTLLADDSPPTNVSAPANTTAVEDAATPTTSANTAAPRR